MQRYLYAWYIDINTTLYVHTKLHHQIILVKPMLLKMLTEMFKTICNYIYKNIFDNFLRKILPVLSKFDQLWTIFSYFAHFWSIYEKKITKSQTPPRTTRNQRETQITTNHHQEPQYTENETKNIFFIFIKTTNNHKIQQITTKYSYTGSAKYF